MGPAPYPSDGGTDGPAPSLMGDGSVPADAGGDRPPCRTFVYIPYTTDAGRAEDTYLCPCDPELLTDLEWVRKNCKEIR